MFYLGQNEGYSPGESISDSSEKPLWRGSGEVSIYVILVKGEYMKSSTYFLQKVAASLVKVTSHEEQKSS